MEEYECTSPDYFWEMFINFEENLNNFGLILSYFDAIYHNFEANLNSCEAMLSNVDNFETISNNYVLFCYFEQLESTFAILEAILYLVEDALSLLAGLECHSISRAANNL